jgi:hypothetical protein
MCISVLKEHQKLCFLQKQIRWLLSKNRNHASKSRVRNHSPNPHTHTRTAHRQDFFFKFLQKYTILSYYISHLRNWEINSKQESF